MTKEATNEPTNEDIISMFERQNLADLEKFGGVKGFVEIFRTNIEEGLPESEMDYMRETHGVNILPDPPSTSWFKFFIECFKDHMLQILLVAAVISLILTSVFPEGDLDITDYIDTISIFVAVLIVAIVQASTNYSQQKAFQEINKLKNEFPINVIRKGELEQIQNTELLVGDILSLKNGNRVAADALYISGHNLKINNSQETGESVAIEISEQSPFILGGGAVESGDALALVCAVGPNSQSGVTMMQIQKIDQEKDLSPLEKKLNKVANILTFIGLGGAILTFIVLLTFWIIDVTKREWSYTFLDPLVKHFMTAITIFICAVPEGLPLAVTISLGFSMKKMMKDNNFVRHLNACETMGGATTICSDKTGTLTQNKMTVVKFYQVGRTQGLDPELEESVLERVVENIAINSSAYVSNDDGEEVYVGPSSECALLQMLPNFNADYKEIRESNPIVVLHEFNSERKRMSTLIQKDQKYICYTKGAPDYVLRLSNRYMTTDGSVLELTDDVRAEMLDAVSGFADQALRTMLLAFKDLETTTYNEQWKDAEYLETDLVVVAIVGIADPLRPEVVKAIDDCREASVIVRMVTGDYINTAKAIASECGILSEENGEIAIEGKEFASKSKLELLEILPKLRVMARSSPRDKLRLVSLLMESGEVVAVTGDGSNDSAALKKANVGLSMGQCGTELAKMASDIVILDDNFNSIVNALKWGRCIYDNVRSFLQFQLTVNLAAMIIAFVGSVYLKNSPLTTLQLLWVNLIMDSFGALALATRGPYDALIHRPPYGESDGLLSNVLIRNIVGQTVYQMVVLFLILFGGEALFGYAHEDTVHISTVVFNTFVFCQVFNLINSRVAGHELNPFDGIFKNPYFIVIWLVIVALQALIIEVIYQAFTVQPLHWKDWLICLGFGIGSLVIGVILRFIKMPDHTTQKLDALRAIRKQEMTQLYQGMSAEEQWTYDPNANDKESS